MSAFARHGIKHLSASSLGLWRENPGLWSLKYLGGFRDDAGPAAWRGSAVEGGYTNMLRGQSLEEAKVASLAAYDATCVGEVSDEIEAERALISPMLDICSVVPIHKAPLVASQLKIEYWLDDIDVPLIGFIDLVYEDGLVVDLKTTKACPSSAKPAHARQVSVYLAARDAELGSLLYVTNKKYATYFVGEPERSRCVSELRRDALSLKCFLDRFETGRDVMNALPMNDDDFRWSQKATDHLRSLETA